MSDAELVRQTLTGRTEAYEELVRRWAGRVTSLCHAKVGCASADGTSLGPRHLPVRLRERVLPLYGR